MNKKALRLLAVGSLALVGTIRAEQGGGGHYVPGATASFIDALPDDSGLTAKNSYLNYSTSDSTGLHGLPFGADLARFVEVKIHADRIQLLYAFEPKILGGHYAVTVEPSFVWENVSGNGIPYTTGSGFHRVKAGTASGFGDLAFWPLMLGWKNGDFKYDVRCAVYAPTGNYNKNEMANPGLGYWTFEPGVSFGWLSSKFGTEVSVFSGMDFNTKNTYSDYQSGDIVHVDATVAQHLSLGGGNAGLGVNGFYYKQVTKDSGSQVFPGSYEVMAEGVGPVISYTHQIGNKQLDAEVKWLPQTQVDNTTQGNYVWAKIALKF